jgi:hypothetical protein
MIATSTVLGISKLSGWNVAPRAEMPAFGAGKMLKSTR